MRKSNLAGKFAQFSETWSPKIVGEVQGMHVKLAKLKGEFIWHQHDDEDEMFFIVKGRLLIKFRDRDVWLNEGEFLVVPRGVEHCPVAEEEAHLLMFEPIGTLNTGNVADSDRTKTDLERLLRWTYCHRSPPTGLRGRHGAPKFALSSTPLWAICRRVHPAVDHHRQRAV